MKTLLLFISLLITGLCPLISFAQKGSVSKELDKLLQKTNEFSESHPSEKIYIHFDKSFYSIGEDCWFKAYVLNRSDLNPTYISGILYVDLIDPTGKLVKHQRLKIEDGGAFGDFALDSTFFEGNYTIRAYTNWMKNEPQELFFTKKIPVLNTRDSPIRNDENSTTTKIDLQFFPEGGHLIAGINTQMAFKAIDQFGRSIAVKGYIKDDLEEPVATFQSAHHGMGLFPFMANSKKTYTAVLKNGDLFPFPKAEKNGFMMMVSNLEKDRITVSINAKLKSSSANVYLIGRSNGELSYSGFLELKGERKNIAIQKENLPEGVFQLTLFDSDGIPQSERKIFIQKPENISLNITGDKVDYLPRDSILVHLKIQNSLLDSLNGSLSVSITDADIIDIDSNVQNIYTSLLLQSELKGKVEQAGWYFDRPNGQKRYALDLVMLTHGWSRYNWSEILSQELDPIAFLPEQGININGQILSNKKSAPFAPITLVTADSTDQGLFISDAEGLFTLSNLDFTEGTLIAWPDMKKRVFYKNPSISLSDSIDIPDITPEEFPFIPSEDIKIELFKNVNKRLSETGVWNLDNSKMLDEIVVTANKKRIYSSKGVMFMKPGPEDYNISTHQYISRNALAIPMAVLRTMPDGSQIWTTPIGGPIIISINGFLRQDEMGLANNPRSILGSIAIKQIELITISGDAKSGYFISVITNGGDPKSGQGVARKRVKGYDLSREFYHPKYGPDDISLSFPDNRMTLYWNANLTTDATGNAEIKFYNSDSGEKFNVQIEGVINGKPVSKNQIIGKVE